MYSGIRAQENISKWQSQPIIVDGNLSDWGSIPRFFDSESNVQYEFRNDAQNLYLVIRSTDRATQIQLQRAGFSVRLKVKTSPPTKFGILFTPPKMPGMLMDRNPQDKLVEKFSSKPEFFRPDSALLDGFLYSQGIITSENKDLKGICFAKSKASRDQVVVEFQIPLKEMYGNDFSLVNIIGIPIQFQVIINELSENANKSHGRMNGGMRGGGMRGRMPGGGEMRGGGMPRGGEEMGGGEMGERPEMPADEMPEKLSFSRKSITANFKLSANK